MALNSVHGAEVPLRNCSLIHFISCCFTSCFVLAI